jgi:predicted transcriptional regulator
MRVNDGKEKLILDLLANDYTKAILAKASDGECSASQLSQSLDIPLATVYRQIKSLEDLRLIQHTRTIGSGTRSEERFYRCRVREVKISIHDGMFLVETTEEDSGDKLIRLWKGLANHEKDTQGESKDHK